MYLKRYDVKLKERSFREIEKPTPKQEEILEEGSYNFISYDEATSLTDVEKALLRPHYINLLNSYSGKKERERVGKKTNDKIFNMEKWNILRLLTLNSQKHAFWSLPFGVNSFIENHNEDIKKFEKDFNSETLKNKKIVDKSLSSSGDKFSKISKDKFNKELTDKITFAEKDIKEYDRVIITRNRNTENNNNSHLVLLK